MEYISGNVFIRPNVMTHAGNVTQGHSHNFDHTTIVYKGAVLVEAKLPDGTELKRAFISPYFNSGAMPELPDGVISGGHHFLVRAGVEHKITALVDDTHYDCVYSHRTPLGDIVQEWTGWLEATH